MDQAEYLNRRDEYTAKAALLGLAYDWFDHTFNRPPDEAMKHGALILDPDTLEELADAGKDEAYYYKIISERAAHYGKARHEAQPNHG